jgi:hypothetical protein
MPELVARLQTSLSDRREVASALGERLGVR